VFLAHHGNTAGNQIHNSVNLFLFWPATSENFKKHRGRGITGIANKDRALRDSQVHTGIPNATHAGNGAGKLTLKPAPV
jgi:hypothetical protein